MVSGADFLDLDTEMFGLDGVLIITNSRFMGILRKTSFLCLFLEAVFFVLRNFLGGAARNLFFRRRDGLTD